MMKMNASAWALVAVAVVAPCHARAEEPDPDGQDEMGPEKEDGFELELGGGAFFQPDYKGSKDYKVRPLPWGSLSFRRGDRFIEISGPSLRANIIGGGRIEFGPTLSSEMGRDSNITNMTVRRLGRIRDASMAGAFSNIDFDLGKGTAIQVGAEATADLGHTNNGKVAKFDVSYRRLLNDRWMVMTGVSTSWADNNYMGTYFGVTPAGAQASGLPAYTAKSGLENIELSSALYYRLNQRWSVIAFARYQRLLGAAADSPIIRQEGSADQPGIGLVVLRKF